MIKYSFNNLKEIGNKIFKIYAAALKFAFVALIFAAVAASASAVKAEETEQKQKETKQTGAAKEETKSEIPFFQFKIAGDFGFLAVLKNTAQFGKDGSTFNYRTEAGQKLLLPTGHITAEFLFDNTHSLLLLYQPLDVRTSTVFTRDVKIDGTTFPKGTPVNVRYGFDFWRASYLYNFFGERPYDELSIGFSMQLRNAALSFVSADGKLGRSNANIGPVPALKLRGRWEVAPRIWLGAEADGIYAPIKYINGSDSDVVGAFYDVNLRAGYRVTKWLDAFINLRYVGGGASGTSKSGNEFGDGYTSNWIQLLLLTVGMQFDPLRIWD